MSKVERTLQIIDSIEGDTVILMCSLGKDSLVCLDLIAGRFKKVICVFMYFVKGLEHIERHIKWVCARYPNVEFVQVPHWTLSYALRTGIYCVAKPKVKVVRLYQLCDALRKRYNCENIVLGMKKSDGLTRLLMLKSYEHNNYINKGYVYPLAEWTQMEVLAYMKQHRLLEPVRYSKKAGGGVGFNLEFMLWARENAPRDLEKIYKVFPLCRRILFEYDNRHLSSKNQ